MKNKKLVIGLAAVLVVVVAAFSLAYFTVGPGGSKEEKNIPSSSVSESNSNADKEENIPSSSVDTGVSDTQKAEKQITVKVVFKNKTEKEFEIDTDAKYLGDALLEEGIITEDEYKNGDGMYTYIAGERADYTKDKSWWCLTISGEMAMVGINDQPIADGDSFELTNTPA